MTTRNAPLSGPRALRALLNHEPIVRCLGAHDVLSAKLIEQAGLECLFVGGFGCSASFLGLPDMNLITLTDMASVARRIANAVHIPLIVDGDTGHGDLHNVQRTFRQFEELGAAGILLEDQVMPKRCGHFEGKQVVPVREMVLKVKAALDVRQNPDVLLIARTDARAVHGLHDAIERACQYGEAGADVCYVEAPVTVEEMQIIADQVPYPLLANMLTGGRTPSLSVGELAAMGYKIALWPIESVLGTAHIIQKITRTLMATGRLDTLADEMMSFQEMQILLGLPDLMNLRARIEGRVPE